MSCRQVGVAQPSARGGSGSLLVSWGLWRPIFPGFDPLQAQGSDFMSGWDWCVPDYIDPPSHQKQVLCLDGTWVKALAVPEFPDLPTPLPPVSLSE